MIPAQPLSMSDVSLNDAVRHVRTSVGVACLPTHEIWEMTGPDALTFLQNRLSNDVAALAPGQGQLNAALDRQGKIEGVFSLHRTQTGFRVLLDSNEAKSAIAGIQKYRIMEQVEFTSLAASKTLWTCQGPKALAVVQTLLPAHADVLAALPEFGSCEAEVSRSDGTPRDYPVWVVRRTLSGEPGFIILVAEEFAQSFEGRLKVITETHAGVEMSPAVMETLRIEAGLPRFGKDYTQETLLPETGLERLAVSYSKGCYLGQETIARIKTYGMLQRALSGLVFDDERFLPSEQASISHEGRVVGTITSCTFSPTLQKSIAMAMLGKAVRIPGRRLELLIDGTPVSATVVLLPFYDAMRSQKSATMLLEEGLKCFSEGFDEEAIRVLRQAVALEPSNVAAYEALGVILSRQDHYDEAIQMMETILTLDPEHVLAHTNLSVYYMKLGDKEKAEEEKAKATMAAFSKRAKESGLVVDWEAEQRRKDEATLAKIGMFEEALRFSPEDPLGNFGLGMAYLELKRYGEAIVPLQKTIQAQPKHSVAYLNLGKALEGVQQLAEATAVYQKGIEIAVAKGDLMPLKEMQARLEAIQSA